MEQIKLKVSEKFNQQIEDIVQSTILIINSMENV